MGPSEINDYDPNDRIKLICAYTLKTYARRLRTPMGQTIGLRCYRKGTSWYWQSAAVVSPGQAICG